MAANMAAEKQGVQDRSIKDVAERRDDGDNKRIYAIMRAVEDKEEIIHAGRQGRQQ